MLRFGFDDLRLWARSRGIELDEPQWQQVRVYVAGLLQWNRRVNLISRSTESDVLCKHVADSLVPVSSCGPQERVVDLGSGAGFPGILLAIARPDLEVTLIEANGKKVSFLTEAIRSIGLPRVRILEARIGAGQNLSFHAAFTLAIARALTDLAGLLGLAKPLLLPEGRTIAMKGPGYQTELKTFNAGAAGFRLEHVLPYHLPDGAARFLLDFRLLPDANP